MAPPRACPATRRSPALRGTTRSRCSREAFAPDRPFPRRDRRPGSSCAPGSLPRRARGQGRRRVRGGPGTRGPGPGLPRGGCKRSRGRPSAGCVRRSRRGPRRVRPGMVDQVAGERLEAPVGLRLLGVDGWRPAVLPRLDHLVVPVRALDEANGDRHRPSGAAVGGDDLLKLVRGVPQVGLKHDADRWAVAESLVSEKLGEEAERRLA